MTETKHLDTPLSRFLKVQVQWPHQDPSADLAKELLSRYRSHLAEALVPLRPLVRQLEFDDAVEAYQSVACGWEPGGHLLMTPRASGADGDIWEVHHHVRGVLSRQVPVAEVQRVAAHVLIVWDYLHQIIEQDRDSRTVVLESHDVA